MLPPKEEYDFQAGATLLVDKPQDWTSFDVVNKIRFKLKRKLGVKKIKVGHAGTLDPMATGLLIICTGKNTKKIQQYQDLGKTYTGTITLGATTPSYDAETEPDAFFPIDHIDEGKIINTTQQFIGEIQQIPPMFSAIKVDGQPLYKKARKGEVIERKPRTITISEFTITSIEMPNVNFRVKCSKGTYIRSLAYDFGAALESGAHLTKLIRTDIGDHSLEMAWNLDELVNYLEAESN
ncbi:MAG: tRNA pseudouridine(55) synthase TruB [Bacteroidota bacterium]